MKLCSACLLGIKCRYDGKSKPHDKVIELSKDEVLLPVCPELLGGQRTPRPETQIINGDGFDVLRENAKVVERNGKNLTKTFVLGANEVLKLATSFGIKEAILKQRSPSCGCGQIYDGTFSGRIIKGDGVTTALLKEKGIKVTSEEDL